jgi:uncharacterized protein (UPF0335 family)
MAKPKSKPAPAIGHNSGVDPTSVDPTTARRLKSFVERIERLEAEIKDLNGDKAEVYAEARGTGFDPKIIREVVKLRKMEEPDRKERDELLELYRSALDMASDAAPPITVTVKPAANPDTAFLEGAT